MTERRTDPVLHRRMAATAILGVAGIALRVAETEARILPPHPLWAWLAGLLLVACAVSAIRFFAAAFRCRECGAMIPRPAAAEGSQITYRCPHCGIEWDTGWRVPWDSNA
jgi:predicted RNA-binding Zn-ribbon protein involved in translation (DUF1610 family)